MRTIKFFLTPGPALATLCVAVGLVGCSTNYGLDGVSPLESVPIRDSENTEDDTSAKVIGQQQERPSPQDRATLIRGPSTPSTMNINDYRTDTTAPGLEGAPVGVSFDSVPISEFVEAVFGQILGVTYEISNEVARRDQIVTLRTAEELDRDSFYQLVVQVLNSYDITVVYQGGAYRIIARGAAKADIPQVIRARAYPNVPTEMRPIFFVMPLNAVGVDKMSTLIQGTVGSRVTQFIIGNSDTIVLLGSPDDVAAVAEMIRSLDQPALAGRQSFRIEPVFWTAQALADRLQEVLSIEGYSVEVGSSFTRVITFLPIPELNIILVFAPNEELVAHILDWAQELDKPAKTLSEQGIFYLPIKNASAKSISDLIERILGLRTIDGTRAEDGETKSKGELSSTVIVDEARNAIVFRGTSEQYAQVKTFVDQVDRAPLQVLIEATVAEVTLTDGVSLGVDWAFNDSLSGSNSLNIEGSSAGLRFSIVRDNGQLAANLNALVDQQRVAILSSPRVITTSGSSANITAGNQIPVITTRQTGEGQTGGTSNILQEVQYRSTGVTLDVSPVINSSKRVELTVTQSVNDAQANDTSSIDSPIILTRSVSTTLSVEDGETVLLGGLITENRSSTDSGVPWLKDIPLIGNAFKSRSESLNKTELIVLLTPYIIDNSGTGRALRDTFRSQLSPWAQVQGLGSSSPAPGFGELLQ